MIPFLGSNKDIILTKALETENELLKKTIDEQ